MAEPPLFLFWLASFDVFNNLDIYRHPVILLRQIGPRHHNLILTYDNSRLCESIWFIYFDSISFDMYFVFPLLSFRELFHRDIYRNRPSQRLLFLLWDNSSGRFEQVGSWTMNGSHDNINLCCCVNEQYSGWSWKRIFSSNLKTMARLVFISFLSLRKAHWSSQISLLIPIQIYY